MEFKVSNSNFDSAYLYMMYSLRSTSGKFDCETKTIDAEIEFKLGPKGRPEEISVSGSGVTDDEKKYIDFYLGKFSGIEMSGTRTIAVEGYHYIYMYSIDVSVYFPLNMHVPPARELFFTGIKKQEMLARLDEHRKDIKKYLRKVFGN